MKKGLIAASFLFAGCASMTHSDMSPQVVKPATDAQRAALLDKVKMLEGTWEMQDEKGQKTTAAIFSVGAKGTSVREIMFPGSPEEMTNMYTMDGDALLMTHYCAMGNQPHMKAHMGSNPNVLEFKTAGVSNLNDANGSYMGSMTLTIVDKDHVKAKWIHVKDGKPETGESPEFVMMRKK